MPADHSLREIRTLGGEGVLKDLSPGTDIGIHAHAARQVVCCGDFSLALPYPSMMRMSWLQEGGVRVFSWWYLLENLCIKAYC